MRVVVAFIIVLLNGCSSISPYGGVTPIDEAIKLCGLGYSSDAQAVVKAAYAISDNSKNIDFGAELKENLNSQVMQFVTHSNISSSEDKTPLINLINKTQNCVVDYVEKTRPLTRQRIIEQCREELQINLAGKGNRYPIVRNTIAVLDHPDYSENNVIMYAYMQHRSSRDNYNVLISCEVKDNKYYGLSVVKENN